MKLDISELYTLEGKEIVKKVNIDMEHFQSKAGKFPITKSEPFDLMLANEENKRLRIQGETDVTIAIPCDRCLEEVLTSLHLKLDEHFPIQQNESGVTSEDEEAEYDYVDGFYLDVDRLIYGEILVNWPVKILCKQDCKGICMKCGINLNLQTCDCEKTELDPRMAAFQDVFNKFKEV